MRKIYSKAERVIGWLGPDENGGSQALKTFECLFRNVVRYPDNFEWVRRMPELFRINGTYTTDSGEKYQSNDRLEKMLLFLRRPFWRRVWIVQEMVLAVKLTLLYGDESTDMLEPDLFKIAIDKLGKIPQVRPQSAPLLVWARLYECVAPLRLLAGLRSLHPHRESQVNSIWNGISGFLAARIQLQFHQTSDPRDHIYGLLGLIDMDIVPDYGEDTTVADVYLEVARYCLKTELMKPEFRNILALAGTRPSCNGLDNLTPVDLPSWVPDWRFPPPARVRLPRYPQSHAFPSNCGLQVQVIDGKWLRGSAVVWDTVSRTEHKTGWDLTEWDLAQKIDIEKPGDLAYPSGISRFKAMVILWHGGYDGSKTNMRDLQLNSDLFRSYEFLFFANVAKPWVSKIGLHEMPKLNHLIFGGNRPTSAPMDHRELYVTRSRQLRYDIRCFHTERGYIGFGPLATDVGDVICVLEGHKAPVILRRRGSHYIFVGDCDVVGIMNGEVLEAVKRGETERTEIEIR